MTHGGGKWHKIPTKGTIWRKCYDNGSLQFAFQPDEDENPMGIPFEFIVVPDTTRSVGEQLYRIKDMQSTS